MHKGSANKAIVSVGSSESGDIGLFDARGDKVPPRDYLISYKVFLKSFCRSQFPHKSVKLFSIISKSIAAQIRQLILYYYYDNEE